MAYKLYHTGTDGKAITDLLYTCDTEADRASIPTASLPYGTRAYVIASLTTYVYRSSAWTVDSAPSTGQIVPNMGGDDGGGGDGEIGPPGVAGATGATGAAGATGASGPVGPPGSDGVDGDDGQVGPPGATGSAGATGATGAAGQSGPQGDRGDDGADGDMGPPGPVGPTGATGSPGSTGPAGPAIFLAAEDGEEGSIGPPATYQSGALPHVTAAGVPAAYSMTYTRYVEIPAGQTFEIGSDGDLGITG